MPVQPAAEEGARRSADGRPFDVGHKLGEGTFGRVYVATHMHSRDTVAIKAFHRAAEATYDCVRETLVLCQVKHAHIINVREVCYAAPSDRFYMVMDRMQHDLHAYAHAREIGERERCTITLQIAKGLDFLRSRSIMHRDLKPANTLIDAHGTVVISDFGASRTWRSGRKYTLEVCTLAYRAPEVLRGRAEYDMAVDAWSLGCIYMELLRGDCLFASERCRRASAQLRHILGAIDHRASDDDVLWKLNALDPKERLRPDEAVAHLERRLGIRAAKRKRGHDDDDDDDDGGDRRGAPATGASPDDDGDRRGAPATGDSAPPDASPSPNRRRAMTFVANVCETFHLSAECAAQSAELLDRHVYPVIECSLDPSYIVASVLACVLIAAKLEEYEAPTIDELRDAICDPVPTVQSIAMREKQILAAECTYQSHRTRGAATP